MHFWRVSPRPTKPPARRHTPTGPALQSLWADWAGWRPCWRTPLPSPAVRSLTSPRRAVVVLCADNGVVAQGVSQTGQEVTRAVAENLAMRRTSVPDGPRGPL